MPSRCPRPGPSAALPALRRGDVALAGDTSLVRLYRSRGRHPVMWSSLRGFGPVRGMRFDHHPPPPGEHRARAVLYAAVAGAPVTGGSRSDPFVTALAETFARTRVLDRTTDAPYLAVWVPTRPLRLLLLSDSDWLTRAGGNSALTAGSTVVAQQWSRAIWNRYDDVDGLCWASSPRPRGRSVALFERARDALPAQPGLNLPLSHPGLDRACAAAARTLGYLLLE